MKMHSPLLTHEAPDDKSTLKRKYHIHARQAVPTFDIRAAAIKNDDASRITAVKICIRKKEPLCRSMSAPALGVPTRIPIPAHVKLMPIRAPTTLRSEVRFASAAFGRDTNEPDRCQGVSPTHRKELIAR